MMFMHMRSMLLCVICLLHVYVCHMLFYVICLLYVMCLLCVYVCNMSSLGGVVRIRLYIIYAHLCNHIVL